MITIEPPSSSFDLSGLNKSGLTRYLNRARAAVGLAGEVDVLLTSDLEVKRLNKAFRGKNKATDVLSFPAPEEAGDVAGDVAISLETALRQAEEHGHSLRDELRVLMLHGLLHLDGEDHETDRGEMAGREARLRGELGLASGLIERVAGVGAKRKATAGSSASLRNDNKKTGNGKSKKATADSSASLRNDNRKTGNSRKTGNNKRTGNGLKTGNDQSKAQKQAGRGR